jgi:hypothetical protein
MEANLYSIACPYGVKNGVVLADGSRYECKEFRGWYYADMYRSDEETVKWIHGMDKAFLRALALGILTPAQVRESWGIAKVNG